VIDIKGLVIEKDYNLIGFIVNYNGNMCILTKKTIAIKSKKHKIKNGNIRKETLNGDEFIYVDVDDEVIENVLTEEEAIEKYGAIV